MKTYTFICLRNGIKYEVKAKEEFKAVAHCVREGITEDNGWHFLSIN